MLRAYGPDCDGSSSTPSHGAIPAGATWIDLEEPTREEEKLVEQRIGLNVPTQEEMAEIEPSSRLYERNGALYMTLARCTESTTASRTTTPISFVLAGNGWSPSATRRPSPFLVFAEHVRREPELAARRDRPSWSGCSTRSSTGWPTSWRASGARDRSRSPTKFSARKPDERPNPGASG